MSKIVFKDHKAFLCPHEEDKTEIGMEPMQIFSLARYLGKEIELESGTMFDDLWKLIEPDASLYEVIFNESLGNHKFAPFIKAYAQEPDEEDLSEPTGMKVLTLSWDCLYQTYEGKKYFSIHTDFGGDGFEYAHKLYHDEPDKDKLIPQGYSLSFFQPRNFKLYPLILDKKIKVYHQNYDKNKFARSKDPVIEGDKFWTVYDVLLGIFDEMTFTGYPDDKTAYLAELDQRVAECRDMVNSPLQVPICDECGNKKRWTHDGLEVEGHWRCLKCNPVE